MRFLPVLLMIVAMSQTMGCSPASQPVPATENSGGDAGEYNVLLILIDTLRADHLGAYGYTRPTSPFLDRLAAEGVLFEEAWTTSSYTREAVASLFTGLYPSANPYGSGWYARPAPDAITLASVFQDSGYQTGMFSNSPMVDNPAFYQGFDEYECLVKEYGVSGQGPRLATRAEQFIAQHHEEKWFMYLHFLDPHGPYTPPRPYYLRFAESIFPHPLELVEQVRPALDELVADGFAPGDARFDDLVIRYDAEIAFVDDTIRGLIAYLESLDLDERTLVVVTADHGEEFLEHGFVEHGWYLYRESTHIPLIFWAPGLFPPGRVPGAVSIVDIMPTLLELKGLSVPAQRGGGRSLLARDQAPFSFVSHGQPVLLEMLLPMRNVIRTVIADGYAYFAAQQWLTPSEAQEASKQQARLRDEFISGRRPYPPIWSDPVHEEIYSLREDPAQHHNLLADAPEVLERLRGVLAEYSKTTPVPVPDSEKLAEDGKQPANSGLTDAEREQLDSLGYVGEASPGEAGNTGVVAPAPAPEVPSETEEQLRNLGYL